MGRLRPPGAPRASVPKRVIADAQRDERNLLKAAGRKLPAGVKQADGYQNFPQAIGYGTNNALSASTYGFNPITRVRTLLEWIYRGSWMGGVAVDIIADDMTRAGIEIQSTMKPEDIEALQKGLVTTGCWGGLNENCKWGRLYGGSIAVFLIDGQDMSTPLDPQRVGKGDFKGLLILDRWMVDADLTHLVQDFGPEMGNPKFYTVNYDAPALRGKRIHYSRVIRAEGIKLPYWQRVMENMWGLSIFERLYDRMIAFDSATLGMAQLVYKSYIRVFKMKGLRALLSEGGMANKVVAGWVEMMRQLQGNEGITLIDADDEFTPTASRGFAGIDEAVRAIAEQLSGALQIPLTRLLGQSPAGLNSSGESDLRTYYDGIKQQQELTMREGLTRLLRVLAASLSIKIPDEFGFEFVTLWQLSEAGKSEVFARDAGTISDLEASGVISLATALKELRQSGRVTGRMTNITDEEIKEAEDAPPRPRIEEGMGVENNIPGEAGTQGAGPKPGGAKKPSAKGDPGKDQPKGEKKVQHDAAYQGLPIVIEAQAGERRWPGGPQIKADYGYIRGVPSAEPGEDMDCFVGPHPAAPLAYIFDMYRGDGSFEEHKVMLGFIDEREAMAAFDQSYFGVFVRRSPNCVSMPVGELKRWFHIQDVTRPAVAPPRLVAAR